MRLSEIHRMIGDEGEAFRFLETFKIVERIPRCPKGHEWNLVEKVNNLIYRCHCKAEKTVRQAGTFLEGHRISLTSVIEILYYFSQMKTVSEVAHETGHSRKLIIDFYIFMRECLAFHLINETPDQPMGGGNLVVVDETFLTVRKYNFGRQTAGTTLKLIGMVELDPTRRRETGLCKLVIIPDLKKETFKAFIKPNVIPGSTIFTDSHKSYQWMRSEGFDHHWVNHKRREFSRREGSMIISTNAIEGVWSRVKKLLRTYKVSRPANMDHELYFLEYVWRSRYLRGHGEHGEWRGHAFEAVCRAISSAYPGDVQN
jgi:transposase-like protein